MGETVKDVRDHCNWLISKGRETEAAKLLLPRIEAQRRSVNKEKLHKIQFACNPEQYAAFWTERKRVVEHVVNVTMATDVMNKWLARLTPEIIDLIIEEGFDEAPR